MKMFRNSFAMMAVCLSVWFLQPANAQTPPPPPPNPAAVPIDGGLGLLLAAGAALGARKAWKSQKNKNS
jgi:hypothetical protein